MPVITLPDGSQKTFDQPVTVDEVAASIGAGLRKAALAGRVDGKVVDTSFVIDAGRAARRSSPTRDPLKRSRSSAIPLRICSRRPCKRCSRKRRSPSVR